MATSDKVVEDLISADSRFSLLTDALDQTSLKIFNKILRYFDYTFYCFSTKRFVFVFSVKKLWPIAFHS